MSRRPPLSDSSFLAAVFSPKKNPVPTGLRKRSVVSTKGRKTARVNAFNKMPSINQRVLDESKQREAYLRGDITIADAKRLLRDKAINLGIAKPLKPRVTATPVTRPSRPGDRRSRVLNHLWDELTASETRSPVNITALRRGTLLMTSDQLTRAVAMAAPEIKAAARNKDEEVEIDGKTYNPFFYH